MKVRNKIGSPYEEGGKRVLFVLVLAFIVSLATMIPYIVYDGGYFLMYGDFNVQQYPFYMHGHDAILAGEATRSSFTAITAAAPATRTDSSAISSKPCSTDATGFLPGRLPSTAPATCCSREATPVQFMNILPQK